jgi:nucleoside phosphorylase
LLHRPKYAEKNDSFFDNYLKDSKILFITATKIEKEILHNHIKPIKDEESIIQISKGKQTYYLGVFGKYNITHVSCGDIGSIGRESSLVTTSEAIRDCAPELVIMPGIAFGTNRKEQSIGDVLVSERVTPYEPQRVGKEETINRGKEGPASSMLLNKFRNMNSWIHTIKDKQTKVIVGNILSGEKLIDNINLKEELLSRYKTVIGGEMEGAGVYAACDGHVNHWILVKAICDFADGKKRRNKDENQKIAAESSISLCEAVFNQIHIFEDFGIYRFDRDVELTEKLFQLIRKQIFDENK